VVWIVALPEPEWWVGNHRCPARLEYPPAPQQRRLIKSRTWFPPHRAKYKKKTSNCLETVYTVVLTDDRSGVQLQNK
jgi:hypothetical protein